MRKRTTGQAEVSPMRDTAIEVGSTMIYNKDMARLEGDDNVDIKVRLENHLDQMA